MKKTLIALAFAIASTTVLATDITAAVGRNFGPDANFGSVAVGQQFNQFRGEASVANVFTVGHRTNVVGLNGVLPLTTIGGVSLGAKAGVSYAFIPNAKDGAAFNVGAEAVLPLNKTTSLVGTFERVFAQKRVSGMSGNVVALGIRTTF